MVWAYGIENDTEIISRDNTPLFIEIQKQEVCEENRLFDLDSSDNRTALGELLVHIQNRDRLIIRSLEDLADDYDGLIVILQKLAEKQVLLFSCNEPYISEYNYYKIAKGVNDLIHYFYKRKRLVAYRTAVKEGKVGRPSAVNAEKCVGLYLNGTISKEEVMSMAGISEPTFYRYLRSAKEKEKFQ